MILRNTNVNLIYKFYSSGVVKGAQFRGHRDSQRRSKEGIFRQGEANQLFKVKKWFKL